MQCLQGFSLIVSIEYLLSLIRKPPLRLEETAVLEPSQRRCLRTQLSHEGPGFTVMDDSSTEEVQWC